MADRAGLAGFAAAAHVRDHVDLVLELHCLERLPQDHFKRRTTEIGFDVLVVDLDLAGTFEKLHARRGRFAATGDARFVQRRFYALKSGLIFLGSRGSAHGCTWARCGCSAPGYTSNLVSMLRPRRLLGSMPLTACVRAYSGLSRMIRSNGT